MTMVSIRGVLRSSPDCCMSTPNPAREATNSATMAPMSPSETAICRPAKIDPAAAGSLIWKKMRVREPPQARSTFTSSGSVCRMPIIVFRNTGKKHSSNTITIFDSMPKPNHTMMRGASATFGRHWSKTIYG